jgi:phosphatidylglycerol lysyltransferase
VTSGHRIGRILASALGLVLFCAALFVVHRELEAHSWSSVKANLAAIPPARIAVVLACIVGSYLLLSVGDVLALRHLGLDFPYRRTGRASFISYALAHNLGVAGGASARVRLYGTWGLSAAQIAAVVAFGQLTIWSGFFALAGAAVALDPPRLAIDPTGSWFRALGIAMLGCVLVYLALACFRRRAFRLGRFDVTLPRPGTVLTQIAASAADWTLAGTALWLLVGDAAPVSWVGFIGRFLAAQIVGLASQVPGGLGVFEGSLLMLLPEDTQSTGVVGALVAFRMLYYFLPLAVGAAMLAVHEVAQHRATLARWARIASPWAAALAPTVVGIVVFVAGTILLVSAALPGIPERIAALADRLPLGVIETSHVASSALGVILLVVARGLQRRLDGAYQVGIAVLILGIVASLLKGLDWEEALLLAFALGVLVAGRRGFYRRASLIHEVFTAGWATSVVAVLVGTAWIALLAYRHVAYDSALWWEFASASDVPRALRASVAAGVVLIVFGAIHLLRPARPATADPGGDDLVRAAGVVASSAGTLAPLALLGDKCLLFSDDGSAFVMYGVSGRTWVALGDPVGPPGARRELVWEFHNEVDRHDGWTVFYQVPAESLPVYVDIGLQFTHLGEEAHVPLPSFTLAGHAFKDLRHALRRAETDGLAFEVLAAHEVGPLLPELERVSDGWLARKHAREKRFSVGRFEPRYLARFPLAVVRRSGHVVAFANVLTAGDGAEASIDLMRFSGEAPPILMDYLLTRTMLWARESGFAMFDLGMAPLSGIESRAHAPAWNRLAGLLYRHGEHFYNFQGLRRFKEKFQPEWRPRYLASPGGIVLAPVLLSVAALISGGVSGIVRK